MASRRRLNDGGRRTSFISEIFSLITSAIIVMMGVTTSMRILTKKLISPHIALKGIIISPIRTDIA